MTIIVYRCDACKKNFPLQLPVGACPACGGEITETGKYTDEEQGRVIAQAGVAMAEILNRTLPKGVRYILILGFTGEAVDVYGNSDPMIQARMIIEAAKNLARSDTETIKIDTETH